jgi:hypothetical protein
MIVSLDGSTLTVKPREGATALVALKDGWELAGVAKAAPDDIKPGEFVGIASAPTAAGGDAAVEVFPGRRRSPPSVGREAAERVGRSGRPVSYHGREAKVAIADDTPVVSFAPAIRADVTARAPVFVPAERGSDGALASSFVVVGANGVVPPI